jgi:hypothetical protein
MGLYDEFELDPPFNCPRCSGALTGWSGYYDGAFLFRWRQGRKSPVEHGVDADVRFSPEKLCEIRLPSDFNLIGGECVNCGYELYTSLYHLECHTESGVWTTARIQPSPDACRAIGDGWVQCEECLDAWKAPHLKRLQHCPTCDRVRILVQDSMKGVS